MNKITKEQALHSLNTIQMTMKTQNDEVEYNAMLPNFEDLQKYIECSNTPTKEKAYVIMSPEGVIGLSFSGEGEIYTNLEYAKQELKSKNEWSRTKGYGTYTLVPLNILRKRGE